MHQPTLLHIQSIAKAFGGNQVLQDVNAHITAGEIVGLLGPNGSGKSTLLNIVTGFTAADTGAVVFDDCRIDRLPAHRIVQTGMARTFQLPSMPTKMTVMEVAMAALTTHHGLWDTLLRTRRARGAEQTARSRAEHLLDAFLLDAVRNLPAVAISGGQKKLLSIVCALMAQPRMLLLDEPTAGVHPNLRCDMAAALRRLNAQGMTLVIVEHDMQFIRDVCTRCVVLDRGQCIASCAPDDLAKDARVLQAYLGAATPPLACDTRGDTP